MKRPVPLLVVAFITVLMGCGTPRAAASATPRKESAPKAPRLWGNLVPGPYAVGFRVLGKYDASRPHAEGTPGRPLQVSVWYPARSAEAGAPLRYGDYVALTGSESRPDTDEAPARVEAVARYRELLTSNGLAPVPVDAWLAEPMAARRDVPEAAGRFPVVLVAQGNFHSAHHQAVLCEYLASHGSVVVTTPSQTRISGPLRDESEILASAREQAADLEAALEAVRALPFADASTLALVGHSFGARSAFLLALRRPEVKALVSLDGGIANRSGRDWLAGLADFAPARVTMPVLHAYQDGDEVVRPDFALLESLAHAPRTLVRVDRMRHTDFTSLGLVASLIPGFEPSNDGASARGYTATALYTRVFLEAHVRGSTEARAFLAEPPEAHGLREGLLRVQRWEVASASAKGAGAP